MFLCGADEVSNWWHVRVMESVQVGAKRDSGKCSAGDWAGDSILN